MPRSPESQLGRVLAGRYRLGTVLGQGGMGAVYAAEDLVESRQVAIKTLLPELHESDEIRQRFRREADASAFLQHPHVVEVYELGSDEDGGLFLAMERVLGEPLAAILDAGPLHPRRALVIARQTLLGLGFAHQHGLVHRDLKPGNIMVARIGDPGSERDHVKLLDFGVVKLMAEAASMLGAEKLTRTGVTFGTPTYMAPEQALGRAIDGRADLYSVGVMLFEMLTGAPPFDNSDAMEILRMHISRPPPALSSVAGGAPWCTPELESLIAGALGKKPEQRYSDARAMIAHLETAFASIGHIPNAI